MLKDDSLQKHTLYFFKGDIDRLREIVPDVPPTVLARTIVRDWIEKHLDPKEGEALRKLRLKVTA